MAGYKLPLLLKSRAMKPRLLGWPLGSLQGCDREQLQRLVALQHFLEETWVALGPEELVILGSPEPGRFSSWFSSFSWLEIIPFSSSAHLRIPKGPWWEYPSLVTLAGWCGGPASASGAALQRGSVPRLHSQNKRGISAPPNATDIGVKRVEV